MASQLTTSPAWQRLQVLRQTYQPMACDDTLTLSGLRIDLSRHWLNTDIKAALNDLAVQQKIKDSIVDVFAGKKWNHTEDRAVLHTALRAPQDDVIHVDGHNVVADVWETKARLYDFADRVRRSRKYKNVVNIGIGGSDLGPRLVTDALRPYHDTDMRFHFVSNVDAAHLMEILKQCDPATTLFIVASKTFTTIETLTNAHSARKWLVSALGEAAVKDHFVAVSIAADKVVEFGISLDNMFGFWDWVGGRYSVWSAIGLSVILAIGPTQFEQFLQGAHAMDTHFQEAPIEENIPIQLALLGVWYRNFWQLPAVAVLPYAQVLEQLPRYLQQLDMESNGKSVDRDGHRVDYDTGAIIFGDAGTNGQHAFYQLLHQGTTVVPAEFIVVHEGTHGNDTHQKILLANALAQPDALWQGRTHDNPYKIFEGRRPSTVIHIPQLSPYMMGMLLAMYEHRVFAQSVIWNINAFDQFGVELGKEMANQLLKA
jgi:glucose-6-phosphate isomerase